MPVVRRGSRLAIPIGSNARRMSKSISSLRRARCPSSFGAAVFASIKVVARAWTFGYVPLVDHRPKTRTVRRVFHFESFQFVIQANVNPPNHYESVGQDKEGCFEEHSVNVGGLKFVEEHLYHG